jgi:hypothetical protein
MAGLPVRAAFPVFTVMATPSVQGHQRDPPKLPMNRPVPRQPVQRRQGRPLAGLFTLRSPLGHHSTARRTQVHPPDRMSRENTFIAAMRKCSHVIHDEDKNQARAVM